MNRTVKKAITFLLTAGLLLTAFTGCSSQSPHSNPQGQTENDKIYYENEVHIILSDDGITANGSNVTDSSQKVYTSNDVIYYENMDSYESGNPYGEGTDADKHTAEEAAKVTVVNITEPGIYRLSGKMSHGQIRVDLGEDSDKDEDAVVTLVLDGLDINCDVAPAVIFMNVYECDGNWDTESASSEVDTSAAGANVIISDGSVNNVEGAYVAKIFKDKEGEKKLWKQDGAFYSYMSMNIDGEQKESGILNIKADNEGLDTELHLTINGGNINIFSDNDGINTNEDGVSVTTINGGNIRIAAGLGEEGDGIDSNGWLVINGGTVVSAAKPISDSGLDSSMGSFINGGTVVALGSAMDWAESDSAQVTMNLQFAGYKEKGSSIIVTREDGSVIFAYDSSRDGIISENTREFMGAVISRPQFAVGETYNVYIGNNSDGVSSVEGSEINGIYDVSSITSVNAVQQAYAGTDVRGHGGRPHQANDGMPPLADGEKPQMPNFIDFPDNMQPPTMPEGEEFDPEIMKPAPDKSEFTANENGNTMEFGGEGESDFKSGERPQMPKAGNDNGIFQPAAIFTDFYMQDKVNSFSGIADLTV